MKSPVLASVVVVTLAGLAILTQGCAGTTSESASEADVVAGCQPGGLYCGGDKVTGDKGTLYRCVGGTTGEVYQKCGSGCTVAAAGKDDACRDDSDKDDFCKNGGTYCGGDKVNGNPNALYKCFAGEGAWITSFQTICGGGCKVNAGADDTCNAPPACKANGTYCGGDKVDGDPHTLYTCGDDGKAKVKEVCAKGCGVRSGQDDACNTTGKPDNLLYGGPQGAGPDGDQPKYPL